MILRHKFRSWRVTFAVVKVEETVGLNSNLPDGNHILMWDFDLITETQMIEELRKLQQVHHLPDIYVFLSSEAGHYHALCLERSTWKDAIAYVNEPEGVDRQWFKGGVVRGYFTLRIGLKHSVEPRAQYKLDGSVAESVSMSELVNYDRYETVDRPTGIGQRA